MKLNPNIRPYILPALLALAMGVWLFRPAAGNLPQAVQKIQAQLNDAEIFAETKYSDKNFLHALRTAQYDNETVNAFAEKGINLYYSKNDSLIYWSSNSALPATPVYALEEGTSLLKLKNGWYQATKKTDTAHGETFLALLAVKHDYPFENRFLKNAFAFDLHLPDNLQLAEQKIDGSAAINNLSGKALFYLYVSGDVKKAEADLLLLAAQSLLLLILCFYLHKAAKQMVQKNSFATGFIFLAGTVIIIRAAMLLLNQPAEFYKLEIFDPKYYASSVATPSLGDLIIDVVFTFWLAVFYSLYTTTTKQGNNTYKFLKPLLLTVVFAYTGLVWWIFKTLVLDSVISFEVYNILSLDAYSLFGLLCLTLLLATHFMLSKKVIEVFIHHAYTLKQIVLFSGILATAFTLLCATSGYHESLMFSSVWAAGFCMVLFLLFSYNTNATTRNIIVITAIYSILSTFLIENLYEQKERNQRVFFSSKLVSERDFVAEYLFEDASKRITDDAFVKNYFANPFISKKEVADRVNALYLSGYFDRYSVRMFSFDQHGNSLENDDTSIVAEFKATALQKSNGTLNYVTDSLQNYSYVSLLPLKNDSTTIGYLGLRLLPKIYYGQNVYPELLLGSNVAVRNNTNNYSYAIYQNDKLTAQFGDFPYAYYWNKAYDFNGKEFRFIEEVEWEHGIQRFANGKKVMVSVKREPQFEPVATFSYFFTFYFSVTAIMLAIQHLRGNSAQESLFTALSLSFRTRINYSMLLMILVSFVIIGFITISFFSRQYDNFYTDRLLRKEKVVHASLEYFIQQRSNSENTTAENLSSELEIEVARQAEINSVDINIYNRNGDLKVTSQPAIYDKGIVSKKMNPAAYFDLENYKAAQVTKLENIGSLSYIATYAPVRNNFGEAIAYLGIPYFERSKNIDDEVSSFLVSLMNVYVFLLICAAVLAYFVSNSITRPLTIISEKLRILNLNKENEPIEWNSKDEIGVLVSEYNKMITELEQSAQKLAKGERESAWREMAKQIAHEIKNPLTPMKLSIQYLQRAIDEGNPNIEQLAKKVSKTLEEQIENLSSIATAFSSFAKMPKAENEIIELNNLLKSIVHLFANEEAQVTFTTSAAHPQVFADKNQLVSVFNNLVKNAMQSIPENRKGFVDVHVKEEDGWILITVSDNGSGIPRDNYDKVFVPNFTTKSSGTGLGLAITKQIIDGAGGKIWFESEENVGTTFFVRLHESKA